MEKKTTNEDELAKFADSVEGNFNPANIGSTLSNPDTGAEDNLRQLAKAKVKELKEVSNTEAHEQRVEDLKKVNASNGNGFLPIKMEDLPSKGLFYPEETRMWVKAASLREIKHWSSTDETDLSSISDALNSIIEACCVIDFGKEAEAQGKRATWRDLKEIDRFYIVLAIHDFTFPPGTNDLKVQLDESKDVIVKKDNIDFVKFSDKLMKFYNSEKRCFTFPVHSRSISDQELDVYIPSVGVSTWFTNYVQTRNQRQEGFDQDCIGIAPLLLEDHRGLNNDMYYTIVDAIKTEFTAYEYSLMSKVKKVIETSITPKLTYVDESGAEKTTPLNFRGGIKSIFQPELDIDL